METTRITLSPEDAWRIYELVEELHRYLHEPENYKDPEQITKWLESGVYRELKHVYYNLVGPWFEVDEETSFVFPPPGVKRRFPEP